MRKFTPLFTLLHHNHNHNQNLILFHLLLKPFSSLSSSSSLNHQKPDLDLPSQIFTILSQPQWQKNPSFNTLIPSLTTTHLSSLFNNPNLHPITALNFFKWINYEHGFIHTVHSYQSLLFILVRNGFLKPAENVLNSMILTCGSSQEASWKD
ncbi:hypothetical protein P8452_42290 [Trifolium repens]|nr:hypothetical protein P8452_42290 [Trifolium repens]